MILPIKYKCKKCGEDIKINLNFPALGEPPSPELLADKDLYDAIKDRFWTQERPAEEGWYWAIRENGFRPACVHVVESLFDENKLAVSETGLDYQTDLEVFIHWLGPLPIPTPPE